MGRIEARPSPETISAWEAGLQSDPDNVQLRASVLSYYRTHGPVEKYFPQALWIVQHHPESPYAPLSWAGSSGSVRLPDTDFALIKAAWEQALVDQADNGKVLYNAGIFFSELDPVRAVHLLEQARQLEPENQAYLLAESGMYTRTFAQPPSSVALPKQAQALQRELAAASDPALLADVGSNLIRLGQKGSDAGLKAQGTELINRAISLDPTNENWKTAAQRASLPPPPPPPPPPPGVNYGPNGPVRVAAAVAEANLVRKVDAMYPAAAVPIRISGTVEFTVTINEDGHVQSLQLVRGHPALVESAKNAVQQYVYKPTVLNGNPVPVIAPVIVKFEAPAK